MGKDYSGEALALRYFKLHHAAVMDDQLDHPELQPRDGFGSGAQGSFGGIARRGLRLAERQGTRALQRAIPFTAMLSPPFR